MIENKSIPRRESGISPRVYLLSTDRGWSVRCVGGCECVCVIVRGEKGSFASVFVPVVGFPTGSIPPFAHWLAGCCHCSCCCRRKSVACACPSEVDEGKESFVGGPGEWWELLYAYISGEGALSLNMSVFRRFMHGGRDGVVGWLKFSCHLMPYGLGIMI